MVLTEIGASSELTLSDWKMKEKQDDASTSSPSKSDLYGTPSPSISLLNLGTPKIAVTTGSGGAAESSMISDKGQLPCRNYTHSRHLCLKFPFETTPHQQYCELCYCYICDSAAPCKNWTTPNGLHCHAFDNEGWKELRRLMAPVRSIFCLKERDKMNWIDQIEDCFVFDFNPFDSVDTSECYCYVCDAAAPCKYWSTLRIAMLRTLEVGSWKGK